MSTRGNVVFLDSYTLSHLDEGLDIKTLKEDSKAMEDSYKIYIHSDMYPSGALPRLQEFLQMKGAEDRLEHTSYLSAWFVCYMCMDMIPYTLALTDYENYEDVFKTEKNLENMKKSNYWIGVGLEHQLSDEAEFTYVITPFRYTNADERTFEIFKIHIFYGPLYQYITTIYSDDDFSEYENEEWWR